MSALFKRGKSGAVSVPKPVEQPAPVVKEPEQLELPNLEPTPFELALEYTYGNEGGLSNDKYDRGGITKYGIILEDLRIIGRKNPTAKDIENLTRDEAKAIYKKLYWDKLGLDKIKNVGVAIALFDIGVVRGTGIPPKYAKQICGEWLPLVINAYDPKQFILQFAALSSAGFRAIWLKNPTQIRFKNGWENRAQRLKTLVKYT